MAKLILIDCDGVLLDWQSRFESIYGNIKDSYAIENVEEFCQSCNIENLEPITGAVQAVTYLRYMLGYKFHVITHIGDSDNVKRMRMNNLIRVFGAAPFYKIDCIHRDTPKAEILQQYEGTSYWWIDDFWKNVKVGQELGLKSIHFSNKRKLDTLTTDNWHEIVGEIEYMNWLLEWA